MRVLPVPCLRDNYAYLIEGRRPGEAVVVDPSEAPPVLAALEREGLRLAGVWATHHHWDHVGGIAELARAFEGVPVVAYEGDRARIEGATELVAAGATFEALGLDVRVLHIPGHTLGAVAYVVTEGAGAPRVFTGDTLFGAGCGRLFEGTPAQMYASLTGTLGALPDDALVYCGHEYTEANLRFAAHVDGGNAALAERRRRVAEARAAGGPSVPFTLGEDRATNPFLRAHAPALRAAVGAGDDPAVDEVEVFARLRRAKDEF
ncbi:MAG TPA: hydroxyacylglutathione hydrolase [Polyangiaceae bacterium]|nr:hydroxyacylglutathione hydrolase [Polyangiaceae bacterium]